MPGEGKGAYKPLKFSMLDRAVHNSPPPLDDVGGCDPLDFDEKDPDGLRPSDPGAKLDDGKVDLTYLPEQFPRACAAICRVAEYGEKKYSRGGWLHVPNGFARYTAAMMRHLFGLASDDELDHDAQVAWNALARLELKLRG